MFVLIENIIVELTYCVTVPGISISVRVSVTPITKGHFPHIFGGMLCSQGHCLLIFAMALTLGLRSSFESVFCCKTFFPLLNCMRVRLIKDARKLLRNL